MPVNLFPDSERPQIAVVTVVPGASAEDVEVEVSRLIEKELSTIEQVRRVTSVSKDEASTVTAEFEYAKGLDSAATDVGNALQKVKAALPETARAPVLFKLSSATPAVVTLALRPRERSPLDLAMVRELAGNAIKERLLWLPEVANAEVFGAHNPIIRVALDRDRLERYRVTPLDVRQALVAFNANQPLGLLTASESQFLLKRVGQLRSTQDVGQIPIGQRSGGAIHLGDVADIRVGTQDALSAYHANGEPAIAINLQRSPAGNALRTIADVAGLLPELELLVSRDCVLDPRQSERADRARRRQHARRPARRDHNDDPRDLPLPGGLAGHDARRGVDPVHLPPHVRRHVARGVRVQHGHAHGHHRRRRDAAGRRHCRPRERREAKTTCARRCRGSRASRRWTCTTSAPRPFRPFAPPWM